MNTIPPVMTGPATPTPDLLAAPVAAYLGRFKGLSRQHTESDLRIFTTWCTTHDLDPLTVHRSDLELCVRLMQEIRRFKPSTVSRRTSVITGFYRTCLIDDVLQHSPADYLRRPQFQPSPRPLA